MAESKPPHVVLLSSPGMGHLIPLAEFATRLAHHHRFTVTLITLPTGHSQAQQYIIEALPEEVNTITIPNPPVTTTPNGSTNKAETRIFLSITSNLPYLRTLLETIASTTNLVALVVDIFGVDLFDMAADLDIPPYIFFTSSCFALSFGFHTHELDASFQGEFRDLPEPVRLPGCVPVYGKDLPDPVQDRKNEVYGRFLGLLARYPEAKGILVNSFEDLEPGAVRALKETKGVPRIYPLGPLVWTASRGPDEGREYCLRWLDEQPVGSVLFVSFGSGGTLRRGQMEELAHGLEMGGHRFLWVVKSPNEHEANAAFFAEQSNGDPREYLPEGFLDRTKSFGLVVPSWAPQLKVLGHASTGGFVSHCGWNSAVESIVKGVPLIAWPLHAEQKMNAVMLAEDVKVALRVEVSQSGTVGREEICGLIRCLMEGEEGKRLRKRVRQLSDAAQRALGGEGTSFRTMSELAGKWKGLA